MKKILILFIFTIYTILLQGQNYQNLKVPTVDVNGIVKDKAGNILGSVDKEGKLKDKDGNQIAHFDAFNNTIMESDGQSINKTDVEGNMMTVREKKLYNWKTFHPEAGLEICLVREKNENGDIKGTVHKRYKQYGSSALFLFLYINKLLEDSKPTATPAATTSAPAAESAASSAPAAKKSSKTTTTVKKTTTKNTGKGTQTKTKTTTTKKTAGKTTTKTKTTAKSTKSKTGKKKSGDKTKK
ncbi:MAG: hypothetical protein NW207_04690 [Cytophagales bacterium]|nr:hypothetical protein [Cytophagales bacterium]